jgi:HEAT repeat protein
VNLRRGASAGLRNTRDPAAVEPLTRALHDSDRDVQYQAVIGLAEITGTTGEWAPGYGLFLRAPERYVNHWQEWAKERKLRLSAKTILLLSPLTVSGKQRRAAALRATSDILPS